MGIERFEVQFRAILTYEQRLLSELALYSAAIQFDSNENFRKPCPLVVDLIEMYYEHRFFFCVDPLPAWL